jgi:arylsulfatase A-like enzyme
MRLASNVPDRFIGSILLCFVILFAGSSCGKGSHSQDGSRPNIILISIDTLRADHIHGLGYDRETTPMLDRLIQRGSAFSTAVSNAPWTLPSHASMLTSLYPHTHGLTSEPLALNEKVETLPILLNRAGYKTAGVTTMPHLSPRHGFNRGFDTYICQEMRAPAALEIVLKLLREIESEPFFVFIHLFDVHSDYDPSQRFLSMFESSYEGNVDGTGKTLYQIRNGELEPSEDDLAHLVALYDAGIRQLDNHLEMFFNALQTRNILDNTVIIVTSDHGEEFLEHGGVLHGQTLYDELMRIPLIIAGPEIPEGELVTKQVQIIDIMPTILDLCGVPIPPEAEGRSMVPLMRRENAEWAEIAFMEADWRNVKHDIKRAIRTDGYKLYYDRYSGKEELYDLISDPGEQNNVIESHPEVAESLRKQLKKWMATERGHPDRIVLSDKEREQLQALGYLK